VNYPGYRRRRKVQGKRNGRGRGRNKVKGESGNREKREVRFDRLLTLIAFRRLTCR